MKATLHHAKAEAPGIHSYFFQTERPLSYQAGQFVSLTVPHPEPDNRGTKRWFTLSSSPHEPYAAITTKLAASGGSTFKRALEQLDEGSEVELSEPMGDFVLPAKADRPLIFVAGGIGITPFRSMLSWLAERREQRPIKCLYGVRSEDEIIFQEVFKQADQHVTIVVSEPTASWGGERGRLSSELILGVEQPSAQSLVYLSGPEPMIQPLADGLRERGLAASQIVTDFFPGYKSI